MAVNKKKNNFPAEKKKQEVWCTYCKKPRHTKEKCWKLHGKPPNKEWGSQKFHNQKKKGQGQVNSEVLGTKDIFQNI